MKNVSMDDLHTMVEESQRRLDEFFEMLDADSQKLDELEYNQSGEPGNEKTKKMEDAA